MEDERKTPGFNLLHNKQKPVIYPIVSELAT